MRNIVKVWRSSAAFLLSAFSFLIFVSCEKNDDFSQETTALQFVVSDFPAFGEGAATRAIGLQDAGKSAWEDGDKILVHLYSKEYGNQAVTLTFDKTGNTWKSNGGTLSYLIDENPTITAVYAPDCEIKLDKTIGLIDGRQYGMAEYIQAKTTISGNTLGISFENGPKNGRSYSRLRIATMPEATLTVEFAGFTPAGPNGTTAPESYSLTADDDGNAYLYGSFAKNGSVTATAKHEIYPEEGITATSRTGFFDDKSSTSGQSYVLVVKLGNTVDTKQPFSGDVALKDGSFVSQVEIAKMTDAQKAAAVGFVFWTALETDPTGRTYPARLTDDKVMNADFPHCTNGLIVSLTETEAMAWQSTAASVADWQEQSAEFNPSSTDYVSIKQNNEERILGYQFTKILKAYNENCDANNVVKPVAALSAFTTQNAAPFGSTGWYLPSPKELKLLCFKDIDDIYNTSYIGTDNMRTLNGYFSILEAGDPLDGKYWSSMEQSVSQDDNAIGIDLSNGLFEYLIKSSDIKVRYVCAF